MPAEIVVKISLMSDQKIEKFLQENKISLTVDEVKKIEKEILKRPPTITELIIWSIQGSEHSSYKSSRKFLKKLPTEGPTVILGPSQDSGVVRFCRTKNKEYGLVLSHESHNHPSQVVPFEGAATGVGGIVRDIACMGSKVVACCDMLRFGDIKKNKTKLIASGVIAGIAGYSNPLGIPNLTGDIFFDSSFNENCLVNVSSVGIIETNKIINSFVPKDALKEDYEFILVGKPTDRSGFGGASFASNDLNEEELEQNKGAVQEPNPFLERHLLASFYDLFKILDQKNLRHKIGFKDLGAGGVLCATLELADGGKLGAEIDVEKIHVSEKNLPPSVILCSETQERFCFAVPKKYRQLFLDHFNKKWALKEVSHGAQASLIGKVTKNKMYKAFFKKEVICHAKTSDITEGLAVNRKISKKVKVLSKIKIDWKKIDFKELIKELITSENIASKEVVFEHYDQTVQGNTVLERSQCDSGICAPLEDEAGLSEQEKKNAFAISVAGNARIGVICPKSQGELAVLSAWQKIIASGSLPVAFTDCLNFGSPEIPEEMWEFAEGVKAIAKASKKLPLHNSLSKKRFPTPFVSGNVSFYNRSKKSSVNPSIIISAFGVLKDKNLALKNFFQKEKNKIFLIGKRHKNLTGSEVAFLFKQKGNESFQINFDQTVKESFFINKAFSKNLLASCRSIQEGGLISDLLKMSFASKLSFKADFSAFSAEELFSEFNGFLVEVPLKKIKDFKKLAIDINYQEIATIENAEKIEINFKKETINFSLKQLIKDYKNALREKLK